MTIYLYAKQHNQTGLRYFGKTTRDPYKYQGSGLYWKRHLKKYGKDITTTWVHGYETEEQASEEAIFFSIVYKIVESDEWANMKIENGKDGWPKGVPNPRSVPQSLETRLKKSKALKGRSTGKFGKDNPRFGTTISPDHQAKMQAGRTNPKWTEERRAKVAATWALKNATLRKDAK
jgi:hypothetical protein